MIRPRSSNGSSDSSKKRRSELFSRPSIQILKHEQEAKQRVIQHMKAQQSRMHQRNRQQPPPAQLRTEDSRLDVIEEESPEKGRTGPDTLASKVYVLRRLCQDPAPGCAGEGEEGEPLSGSFS